MIDCDKIFGLLANRHRRCILFSLYRQEQVNAVAAADFGGKRKENLIVELSHTHLPKLAEAGVIDHNEGSQYINRGENFEAIVPVLDALAPLRSDLPDMHS